MKNRTTVKRKSELELVVTRIFNAPARIVYQAWTTPELLKRWWAPKSTGVTLLSCQADVRSGGSYRFEIGQDGAKPLAFFGRYLEVIPNSRLVWTNEKRRRPITTVTFEEKAGKTLVVMHERYPSKEALDATLAGMEGGCPSRSRNWTSFSSPWARAWDGHEAVDPAVGRTRGRTVAAPWTGSCPRATDALQRRRTGTSQHRSGRERGTPPYGERAPIFIGRFSSPEQSGRVPFAADACLPD